MKKTERMALDRQVMAGVVDLEAAFQVSERNRRKENLVAGQLRVEGIHTTEMAEELEEENVWSELDRKLGLRDEEQFRRTERSQNLGLARATAN